MPVCEWVGGCKSLLPDYLILKTASPTIYEINVCVCMHPMCVCNFLIIKSALKLFRFATGHSLPFLRVLLRN